VPTGARKQRQRKKDRFSFPNQVEDRFYGNDKCRGLIHQASKKIIKITGEGLG